MYPVGNQNVAPTAGLPNSNGYAISQGFFSALNPTHAGVDLANGLAGGDVRAIASGRVVDRRESDDTGFGWALRIEHTLVTGEVVYSLYGHMLQNSLTVNIGDTVSKGQIIGQVDDSGLSTGNHLHFSIRNAPDFGCGYVPSKLPQCANDVQSNYREPLSFVSGPATSSTLAAAQFTPQLGSTGLNQTFLAQSFVVLSPISVQSVAVGVEGPQSVLFTLQLTNAIGTTVTQAHVLAESQFNFPGSGAGQLISMRTQLTLAPGTYWIVVSTVGGFPSPTWFNSTKLVNTPFATVGSAAVCVFDWGCQNLNFPPASNFFTGGGPLVFQVVGSPAN